MLFLLHSIQEIIATKSAPVTFFRIVFGDMKADFTIPFNTNTKAKSTKKEEGDEGPVVERNCPKCGNDRMSYATLQLRSADEGQTVFYTCTKCK